MFTILNYPEELKKLTFPNMKYIGKLNHYNTYEDVLKEAIVSGIPNVGLIIIMYYNKSIYGIDHCYPLIKSEWSDLKETEELYCREDIMIYAVDDNKYIAITEPINYRNI